MKEKSIVIAAAVLVATMLTAVFATAQLAYADDSSDTDIDVEVKNEVDVEGDGNTILQCSENDHNSEVTADTNACSLAAGSNKRLHTYNLHAIPFYFFFTSKPQEINQCTAETDLLRVIDEGTILSS